MRSNVMTRQGLTALAVAACLLLAACGGGKGDSRKFAQIVDANRQGIVSIALADNNGYVHLRGTKQFVLEGTNRDGEIVDISSKASWRLSNAQLGKIDRNGLLTPSGDAGQLTLTASYADFSVSQDIIISDANLVSIAVVPKSASVSVCQNAEFTGEALFDNGLVLDYPLTWRLASGTDQSLATFNDANEGVLSTFKSGAVSLVAEGRNNAGDTITSPTISYPIDDNLVSLALTAPGVENLSLREGQTADIRATATYTDDSTAVVTANASLTIDNTTAATLDPVTGLFTAKTGGYGGTPVTVSGSCDDINAQLVLNLVKPDIRSIEIRTSGGNTTTVTLTRGNATTLLVTATFEDSTGTDTNYKHNLAWEIIEGDSDNFDRDKITIDSEGRLEAAGDLEIDLRINLVIEARVLDSEGNVLKNRAGEELRDRINGVINP